MSKSRHPCPPKRRSPRGVCVSREISESADLIQIIKQKSVVPEYADFAIAITDKDKLSGHHKWSTGNARGYAQCFNRINEPYLKTVAHGQAAALVENRAFASISEVPTLLLRSSLQRVIQLLKRHRDCRFDNKPNEDNKPISIIITTLVAQIAQRITMYNATTKDLLIVIVNELTQYAALMQAAIAESGFISHEIPISLNPNNTTYSDDTLKFWEIEIDQLSQNYKSEIDARLKRGDVKPFLLFAIAPQPLLIKLGTLMNNTLDIKDFPKEKRARYMDLGRCV